MLRIVFTSLAFLNASFQIIVRKTPPEEAFLFNFILFNIGLWGIATFIRDYFSFVKREGKIRRQSRRLLQKAVVFFNLFLGILGILCIWVRGDFWLITVIIFSIFIFSHGCYEIKHLEEIVANKNWSLNYTIFVVNFNLLFPSALIVLLVVFKLGM